MQYSTHQPPNKRVVRLGDGRFHKKHVCVGSLHLDHHHHAPLATLTALVSVSRSTKRRSGWDSVNRDRKTGKGRLMLLYPMAPSRDKTGAERRTQSASAVTFGYIVCGMADEGDPGVCEYPQSSVLFLGIRALLKELLSIEVPSIKVRGYIAHLLQVEVFVTQPQTSIRQRMMYDGASTYICSHLDRWRCHVSPCHDGEYRYKPQGAR